jgi:phage terminase small subunit
MPRQSAASLAFPHLIRTERLSPPAELSQDERALFVSLVSTTPADHLRPSDAPLLVAYCRAILLEREAAEHLATQGHVTVDNKPSAWFTIQMQAHRSMLQLARALKMTPTARRPSASRAGKPQQLSYYDQMRLEQEGKT